MRSARLALVVLTVGALTLAGVLSAQQPKPAKPMQLEKVKDGPLRHPRAVQSLRAERLRRGLRRRWTAARGGRRGSPSHAGRAHPR